MTADPQAAPGTTTADSSYSYSYSGNRNYKEEKEKMLPTSSDSSQNGKESSKTPRGSRSLTKTL